MRVNNWLSGFACVLLLGVVGCKKDKIREGIPVVVEKVGVDDVEICRADQGPAICGSTCPGRRLSGKDAF